jgi:hypothetical protein
MLHGEKILDHFTERSHMNVPSATALLWASLFVSPANAQGPCLGCLKAAQKELIECLANAISEEDKLACEDKQEEQAKACEGHECMLEREETDARKDGLPQGQ